MLKRILIVIVVLAIGVGGYIWWGLRNQSAKLDIAQTMGTGPQMPKPSTGLIPLVHVADVVGWKSGETPTPAPGLKVNAFATGLDHPRWMLALPNGDVLVAETNAPPKPDDGKTIKARVQKLVMAQVGAAVPSANRITLLRDADGDGIAESRTVLLKGLNSPFGMTLANGRLYVADTDAVISVPFTPGQTTVADKPAKLVDLPAGTINHHWTKNVVASPDGAKLYVTIGSNSNVGENGIAAEQGRAAIWEVDAKTGAHRIYAYGLRNPNGMAWEPATKQLFTVVNERDELGSDTVPDYLTGVEFAGFYGWPWYYWGGIIDPRPKDPDTEHRQEYVVRPDYALGPHTASLGLTFAAGAKLGGPFTDGAFVGQHGSWNRRPFSGYKVIFVPFVKGHPAGKAIDVLTGFLNSDEKARGRPVGVQVDRTGALLIADDVGNAIWRVAAR